MDPGRPGLQHKACVTGSDEALSALRSRSRIVANGYGPVGNKAEVEQSQGGDVISTPAVRHRETLRDVDVDPLFREPFIFTGYRPSYQSWSFYLRSMFWLHNETLNVWTHLIGCCVVVARALWFGSELDHFRDQRSWSVLGFAFGCFAGNLLSAMAHLFHSKSPRLHSIVYIADYAGITIYNLGNAVGSMYSCSGSYMYVRLENIFLPVCVFLCWSSFLCMALTRLAYKEQKTIKRKVILVSVMGSNCFFMALPMMCRYAQCLTDPHCSLASLHHITIVFVFFAMDALCFAAHCPERWVPGGFDRLGHGHQWFHVLVIVTQMLQFHAQHIDIIQLAQSGHVTPSLGHISLSFLTLIVAEAVTLIILTCVIGSEGHYKVKVDHNVQVAHDVKILNEAKITDIANDYSIFKIAHNADVTRDDDDTCDVKAKGYGDVGSKLRNVRRAFNRAMPGARNKQH